MSQTLNELEKKHSKFVLEFSFSFFQFLPVSSSFLQLLFSFLPVKDLAPDTILSI